MHLYVMPTLPYTLPIGFIRQDRKLRQCTNRRVRKSGPSRIPVGCVQQERNEGVSGAVAVVIAVLL